MKKKGFTLIELLAVIVILAIIALIATPLVLKYIEKSRKESKVDSAYSFVRNLETEIANYSIKHNGKKYNKSGLVEIGDLTDIDTTVKGDKPDNIKVCLSSLGQVDKAILQYGKYYVNYDGKKGSISDKDTYDNFSCSGNVGDNTEILFEANANFEYREEKEDKYSRAILSVNSLVLDKLEVGYEYDMLMDDEFFTKVIVVNINGNLAIKSIDVNKDIDFDGDSEDVYIRTNFKIEGDHNIKFLNKQATKERAVFYIENGGFAVLSGFDFVEGNAHVLITDEDGTKYFDDNVNFVVNMFEGIYGADYGCRENLLELSNIFIALSNGKKITTVVTQEVKGEKITTTINGEVKYIPNSEYDAYYLGQLGLSMDGLC